MITIVHYGLGNIRAFVNVYERLNIPVVVARTADDLQVATKIILPGVGAFDHAMDLLNGSGMRRTLVKLVLDDRLPILGVCVGMQIMAQSSDEGVLSGLGWIDGAVRKLPVSALISKTWLPHMGWNTIHPNMDSPLLVNLSSESRFYFLHSYYFHCNSKNDIVATTEYGIRFTSIVNIGNIYGVQFHPEKSHQWGIQLLRNFADL